MRRSLLKRPSPGLVLACVALFVALGGGAYAATSSDKKTDKKIAKKAAKSYFNGHITGASVSHADTAGSANSASSATNANNATNASKLGGQPASAYAGATTWALVRADGTIDSQSGGISVSAHTSGAGSYFLNIGRDVSHDPILVTVNYGNFADTFYVGSQVTAAPCGGTSTDPVRTSCTATGTNDSGHVFVKTTDQTGAPADRPFYIVIPG